jgi:hypothetical protein
MEDMMKKIIALALATVAIAATALIAVPAMAGNSPFSNTNGDRLQTQDQTHDQTQDQLQTQDQDQLQDGSCIDEPVAAQATTQEQATAREQAAVQQQIHDWDAGYDGYCGQFLGGGIALHDPATLERVADTLGISYDELVQRMSDGETIADIAVAQNVDLGQVVDTIVAAQTDMINLMVQYGYITQEQADAIIANLRERVETALSLDSYGYNDGYGPGNGCPFYGTDPDDTATPTPGTGYGYGCPGFYGTDPDDVPAPGTGYGPGMMGGSGFGGGMMGW